MTRRETAEPLIIDRAAAAEIPSAEAVREWAHGKRGFVSTVMAKLPRERQAAADAIGTQSSASTIGNALRCCRRRNFDKASRSEILPAL